VALVSSGLHHLRKSSAAQYKSQVADAMFVCSGPPHRPGAVRAPRDVSAGGCGPAAASQRRSGRLHFGLAAADGPPAEAAVPPPPHGALLSETRRRLGTLARRIGRIRPSSLAREPLAGGTYPETKNLRRRGPFAWSEQVAGDALSVETAWHYLSL